MARGSTLNLQIKKLIILKYLSGIKQATIAKQLNLSRSVICKAIKLFRLRKSLVSPPKTGRPRKTTPRIDRKIKTLALKNPCTTAVDIKAQLKELIKKFGLNIQKSSKIVPNYLKRSKSPGILFQRNNR
ncbi:unnamed protein product [Acanthoscelides obtectus]|uniref:Paired domain-containing protein n=1 Tax=Acanthoscelides obtectus TaxID=200917 RepID=A0A9P0LX54_ACAOB|nr:unnamed protein product [Acanthoscelides obtectus]CAK1660306.1 hypothetical protein AOBTE_LOCUS21978 [Acanthoscelides obtectus]